MARWGLKSLGADASKEISAVGAIAQLGERLLCKQDVAGSSPASSTTNDGPIDWTEED